MRKALLAVALIVAVAQSVAAPPDIHAGPFLLVSGALLDNSPYRNTVLVVAPVAGGHVGFVLNRPSKVKLSEIFPAEKPTRAVREPVYWGGHYATEAVFVIVRSAARPQGERTIALGAGLWAVLDADAIDQVILRTPNAARYYVGRVEWGPGKLEQQLASGMLELRAFDAAKILQRDTSTLFRELAPGRAVPAGAHRTGWGG